MWLLYLFPGGQLPLHWVIDGEYVCTFCGHTWSVFSSFSYLGVVLSVGIISRYYRVTIVVLSVLMFPFLYYIIGYILPFL